MIFDKTPEVIICYNVTHPKFIRVHIYFYLVPCNDPFLIPKIVRGPTKKLCKLRLRPESFRIHNRARDMTLLN